VTGIAPFGAFVSVAIAPEVNLSGLIHISEIAWEKVESTASYIKTGQRLDVKAIGADLTSGKLTLSLKQLTPDPWQDVVKMFSIDQTIRGKVARVSDYGIFVTLLPGIEGLIHISKLAPGEEPKLGEEIECTVEEVIPEKRKISLSLVTHAKPIGYR
jgi:4-hydroxy-3-methylbut-2-enyl diphosphate reductase